ncbi:MAG: hypothetical protein RMK74_12915 [Myxococcales bacterium]|nr:hypothetical protein [Myxococcales bacterium]
MASDGDWEDYFGISIALSADGRRALIGAVGDRRMEPGAVYAFVRSGTTWTEQQKLLASDAGPADFFGWSVALTPDGGTGIVGALYDDVGPNVDQGSVYVFVHAGGRWSQQHKLEARDGLDGDQFGAAVALAGDGNTLLVGAPGADVDSATNRGVAYAFERYLERGDPCPGVARCLSGHCVDGVCCESACGGGRGDDCMACSLTAGGTRDGQCTALARERASLVTCRASMGPCDVAVRCADGGRTTRSTPSIRPRRAPCPRQTHIDAAGSRRDNRAS